MRTSHIQLKTASILNVPLQMYDKFTFKVNGKEFETTRLVSDLLSPIICSIHSFDPTIDQFIINTQQKGDFSLILSLVNFTKKEILQSDIDFISEVVEQLGNGSNISLDEDFSCEITKDNVFSLIKKKSKFSSFYASSIEKEIDFISSHFFELIEKNEKELSELKIDILERTLRSSKLKLKDEDQLLKFVNHLYSKDTQNSILYEYVYFTNINASTICDFIKIIDIEHVTNSAWQAISKRLEHEIVKEFTKEEMTEYSNRYTEGAKLFQMNGNIFKFDSNQPFNGIICHLPKKSNGNIESKVKITSSSYRGDCIPINTTLYDNDSKHFQSLNYKDSWICFDFQENKIIPTYYSIKSKNSSKGCCHPKSWVIELSNDNSNWKVCDEQSNLSCFNGPNLVHSFPIQKGNKDKVRYIRVRQTDKNWNNDNDLSIGSFEVFGTLI